MKTIQERETEIYSKLTEMFGDRITEMAKLIAVLLAIAESESMMASPKGFETFQQCVSVMMHEYNISEAELEKFFIEIKLNGRTLN